MSPRVHLGLALAGFIPSIWMTAYFIHVIDFPEWMRVPALLSGFAWYLLQAANVNWAAMRMGAT